MTRVLVRLATIVGLIASALLLPTVGSAPTSSASAADLRYFDPANIISDAVFFDAYATDVGTVEAFLDTKGAKCVAGDMPCLKDYTQATGTQTGDAYCATYPGAQGGETAASIIVKVGRACGINPRVLLVLLQKEQGLVTGTRPTTSAYTKATGFACPDTSPCNPAFSGFASQVYFAARQFQRYAAGVAGSYRAGKTNNVLFHPNAACGSSPVLIQNKATAGLYSYTPYQPNAAALTAGYGTGDGCSSYGNRNFWNYFTDWFGSTQSTGGGAIYSYWSDQGGATGKLGAPIQSFFCGLRNGGCFEVFTYGSVYWSPATGAHAIMGDIGASWTARGWENSTLGYPVNDVFCGLTRGGCFQDFENGSLYWTAGTGAHFVRNVIRQRWGTTGWEAGWLGYPTTDEVCGLRDGGCFNHFEGGSVYSSTPGGVHAVNLVIRGKWETAGWEAGTLGYPVNEAICGLVGGGCLQDFQGGRVYWSAASGAAFTRGTVQAAWEATGAQDGPLGYPVADVACGLRDNGCAQPFQRGWIFWSPAAGGHVVAGDVGGGWFARGAQNGSLGYPTREVICGLVKGGCLQDYQGGRLYWTAATGTDLVRGIILSAYEAASSQDGELGFPVTDEICGLRSGGCFNHFETGSIYWTPTTGAHRVTGAIRDTWAAAGWESGRWGYPVGDPQAVAGGVTQAFQGGTATWNTSNGTVTFG